MILQTHQRIGCGVNEHIQIRKISRDDASNCSAAGLFRLRNGNSAHHSQTCVCHSVHDATVIPARQTETAKDPRLGAALVDHLRSAGAAPMVDRMISTKNPFPGMNPWLQRKWSDVHTKLIAFISEALTAELPQDLAAYAEERVSLESDDGKARSYRGDVGSQRNLASRFASGVGARKSSGSSGCSCGPRVDRISRRHGPLG